MTIDTERMEFINGIPEHKPMGTIQHAQIARKIEEALREKYESPEIMIEREVTFRLGNDILIPDISVFDFEESLLLAIEVRSPSERLSVLRTKAELYHSHGVRYCWIIDPQPITAYEYHSVQTLSGAVMIPRVDLLTAGKFEIDLSRIFSS
jgi:Uma2 family endonuclease